MFALLAALVILYLVVRRPWIVALPVGIVVVASPGIVIDLVNSTTALIVAATMLVPWWGGPIVIWFMHRMSAHPEFFPYDPVRHDLPESMLGEQATFIQALATRGFRPFGDVFQPRENASAVATRVVLMRDDEGQLALVTGMHSEQGTQSVERTYVEFVSKATDGRVLIVNNAQDNTLRVTVPTRTVRSFDDLRDASALADVNRAVRRRWLGSGTAEPLEAETDPSGFMVSASLRAMEELQSIGRYRLDEPKKVYRPTLTGAWVTTWTMLPPTSWIRRRAERRENDRLLEELGLRDLARTARTRRTFDVAWAPPILALLVVGYLILTARPATLDPADLAAQEGIPMGLTVPADFDSAVAALGRWAQAEPLPFAAWRDWTDQPQTMGAVFYTSENRAVALIHALQPAFLERGFGLVRVERSYGYAPDAIAALPFTDPAAILRAVQTDGTNYGIDTDSIVRWMESLATTHAFRLTDAGFDYLEAQFLGEIGDAQSLARAVYAFCPDVVDQGTETVAELAKQLERTQTLYCWWD